MWGGQGETSDGPRIGGEAIPTQEGIVSETSYDGETHVSAVKGIWRNPDR